MNQLSNNSILYRVFVYLIFSFCNSFECSIHSFDPVRLYLERTIGFGLIMCFDRKLLDFLKSW